MRFNNRAMALAGIPDLPEEAFKHYGDRKIKPQGGGGSAPTQTQQTVTQTNIPEYAQPYVESLLGKSQAYSESPYQAYGGQRIAPFTPMQQQAFQDTANLGPARQLGVGTQLSGVAGLGALGAGQQYTQQATNPYAQQAYMSPYIQNALAPQLQEAARQSAIQGQQSQAQAAQQGAFGGARSAIVEAERQRNLGQLQANIYGQGMQNAFQNAQQAQQFGANLGLQGYGQANQAAQTLGQLGQTQFGQQQAAIQAQAAAGAQQQQLQQQQLTQQYQDFLTQRGYPQQQLAFMSDVLRGVPLSQQTQAQYTAPQSGAAQLAQLGLGAYGISKAFGAEGGAVKEYASGGIVGLGNGGSTSQQAKAPLPRGIDPAKAAEMMEDMSPEQLKQIQSSSTDIVSLLAAEEERKRQMARDSQLLSKALPSTTLKDEMIAEATPPGIDSIPMSDAMFADSAVGEVADYTPPDSRENQMLARGGIVALKTGGSYKEQLAAMDVAAPAMTEEEKGALRTKAIEDRQKYLGPDETKDLLDQINKGYESQFGAEEKERQKGFMALKAAGIFGMRGKSLAEQIGMAAAGAAEDAATYRKAEADAKRQVLSAKLDYAKAKRAEKAGDWDTADKYTARAEDKLGEAKRAEATKTQALAQMETQEDIAKRTNATTLAAASIDKTENMIQRVMKDNPNMSRLDAMKAISQAQAPLHDTYNALSNRKNNIDKAVESAVSTLRLQYSQEKDPAKQAEIKQRIKDMRREIEAEAGWTQADETMLHRFNAQQTTQQQPPPQALPMPAAQNQLQRGQIYNTARGPARWNGTAFEAI